MPPLGSSRPGGLGPPLPCRSRPRQHGCSSSGRPMAVDSQAPAQPGLPLGCHQETQAGAPGHDKMPAKKIRVAQGPQGPSGKLRAPGPGIHAEMLAEAISTGEQAGQDESSQGLQALLGLKDGRDKEKQGVERVFEGDLKGSRLSRKGREPAAKSHRIQAAAALPEAQLRRIPGQPGQRQSRKLSALRGTNTLAQASSTALKGSWHSCQKTSCMPKSRQQRASRGLG